MTDLNKMYREQGWGLVTDKALKIEPKDVESQARTVAQWAYDEILKRDLIIASIILKANDWRPI